ncbi:protein Spindly-B-like [Bradysia coprophila]|uniref:protein Spindly-B-like n=1 Tax=Bradysia coprophila TaxID=38358 RepID=UPI00187DCA5E|nr:protein Spindly-B-like [Bradysia coprophila]
MENTDENIENLRRNLTESNADFVRLSNYVARVINDNQKATRMSANKIERLEASQKILESQLELAVSEKFESEGKLLQVQVKRDNFERELNELKQRHEKQQTKLKLLRQEIESTSEQKKEIFAKFKLVQRQERMHDDVVEELKKQLEEKMSGFSIEDTSGNNTLLLEPTNAEAEPANMSVDMVVNKQSVPITDNQVAGSTSITVVGQVNNDEPNWADSVSAESHSMKSLSDYNRCPTVESVLQGTPGRPQVVLTRLTMRKTSGTIIKCSTSTSITSRLARRKAIEFCKLAEIKQPSTALTERLTCQAAVEGRPKRILRCTLCSMRFVSTPLQPLCGCQIRNDL